MKYEICFNWIVMRTVRAVTRFLPPLGRPGYSLLGLFLLAVPLTDAVAQSTDATTAESSDSNLEEIIVTATKRAESIQTVGISVSALQAEELEIKGAKEFADYAVSIPNLSFGATDDGVLANRSITIRGIQGINTTGFYIDDIPLEESVDPLVLDVERIEVLRGPQGTLFGARGLGGTIRVITKQPQFDERSGRIHGGMSSTHEGGLNFLLDGAANIPLSDQAALRFTGYIQTEEGVFDRTTGPLTAPGVIASAGTSGALVGAPASRKKNVDDQEIYGFQGALRIEPTDVLSLNGRVMHQKTELDGFPLADQITTSSGGFTLSADDFTQKNLFGLEEGGEDEWTQLSLNIEYTTDIGAFSSSTGYFTRETNEREDSSEFISFTLLGGILGGPASAVPSPIFQSLEFDTFVEELRFVSAFGGPFEMTTGLFYQTTDDNEAFDPPNIAPGFGAAVTNTALGINPGDLIFTSDTETEIEELGVFGEFSYQLTERLSATLGVRYFDTEVETDSFFNGFAAGGPNTRKTNQAEDGFNFKGLIEYELNDDVFLYTSLTEGFRIGGANRNLPAPLGCPAQYQALGFTEEETETFDSDELLTYEIGAKTTWKGGKVALNTAAFYNDFEDIQQRILLACGFDFTSNFGSARTIGAEVELTVTPTDNLLLQAAVGYTDAEFTDVEEGLSAVEEGDSLQQVPDWTASAAVEYTAPSRFSDFDWFTRTDVAYVDKSISTVVNSGDPRSRPSYTLVNTRLGLKNDDHEFTLFVNNLTDEEAVYSDNRTLAAEAAGRTRVVRNRPRTIGMEFRKRF